MAREKKVIEWKGFFNHDYAPDVLWKQRGSSVSYLEKDRQESWCTCSHTLILQRQTSLVYALTSRRSKKCHFYGAQFLEGAVMLFFKLFHYQCVIFFFNFTHPNIKIYFLSANYVEEKDEHLKCMGP